MCIRDSPYNAQVNFLAARLNKGARVGTIDRFQGQQAPISIISMTSSSVEDLPRNKAFFFNRNRLNVAISRAQCSSIILFIIMKLIKLHLSSTTKLYISETSSLFNKVPTLHLQV